MKESNLSQIINVHKTRKLLRISRLPVFPMSWLYDYTEIQSPAQETKAACFLAAGKWQF